jgi:thioredoxin-related protein
MKKLLLFLCFIFCYVFLNGQTKLTESTFKKAIAKGVVVVEFNAPFNSKNSFKEHTKLDHCNFYRVCVVGSPDLKKKYRITSYPTLIVFKSGYAEKKYKGNIMLELDINYQEVQEKVDELLMNKF